MLNEMSSQPNGVGHANIQECKPDYEGMIKQSHVQIGKVERFLEAVYEYVGNRKLRGKLAELVGELVSEKRQLEYEINRMIVEQEKADQS